MEAGGGMTAGELQDLSAELAEDVAQAEGTTEQALLRGIVAAAEAFDHMKPLPQLRAHRPSRLWEPAARHYQNLTETEKQERP